MATFKTRRLHTAQGGLKVGANGNTVNEMLFATACINCPSAVGDARVTASVAVSNVADGDPLLIMSSTSLPANMFMYSACAIAGGISASFMNSGSANQSASADVEVSYLVLS